jgi:hypothetical protein
MSRSSSLRVMFLERLTRGVLPLAEKQADMFLPRHPALSGERRDMMRFWRMKKRGVGGMARVLKDERKILNYK